MDDLFYDYDYDKEQRRRVPCGICERRLRIMDGVIHHINEKKTDNRPSNLVVLHRGCHQRHHALQRKAKRVRTS